MKNKDNRMENAMKLGKIMGLCSTLKGDTHLIRNSIKDNENYGNWALKRIEVMEDRISEIFTIAEKLEL